MSQDSMIINSAFYLLSILQHFKHCWLDGKKKKKRSSLDMYKVSLQFLQ